MNIFVSSDSSTQKIDMKENEDQNEDRKNSE